MSGGAWGYQQYRIEEEAERVHRIMQTVAKAENICDWSESADTSRASAESELYDLWVGLFNELYGR